MVIVKKKIADVSLSILDKAIYSIAAYFMMPTRNKHGL